MADHIIQFGGDNLPLTKVSNEFTLIKPSAETLHQLNKLDAVTEISRIGLGLWSVRAGSSDQIERLMVNARHSAVTHHSYIIDIPGMRQNFLPTDIVNLKFQSGISNTTRESLINKFCLQPLGVIGAGCSAYRVTNKTGMNPIKLCETLQGDKLFEFVEPDWFMPNELYSSTSSLFQSQWHLHGRSAKDSILAKSGINVEEAWKYTTGSPEIVVAIIDDGFDLTNPDLQGNIVSPSDFTRIFEIVGPDNSIVPDDTEPLAEYSRGDYHGTPCAGLAIARHSEKVAGVAPGCSWMPIRCNIGGATQNSLLQIFRYLSDRADIVSCSWGLKPSGYVNFSQTALDVMSELIISGGRRGKGLIVCFAAGNHNLPTFLPAEQNECGLKYYDIATGRTLGTFFRNRTMKGGWTSIDGVIVVGAVTSRNRKSLYSNWGKTLTIVAPSDNWHPRSPRTRIDYNCASLVTTDNEMHGLGLHQVGLDTTDSGFVTFGMGGTSGATPQVAGVCALILSVNRNLTSDDVRRILINTAEKESLDLKLDESEMYNNKSHSGGFEVNTEHSLWFGYGKVNAGLAVSEALNQ
jgi:subtilisin family serine protease